MANTLTDFLSASNDYAKADVYEPLKVDLLEQISWYKTETITEETTTTDDDGVETTTETETGTKFYVTETLSLTLSGTSAPVITLADNFGNSVSVYTFATYHGSWRIWKYDDTYAIGFYSNGASTASPAYPTHFQLIISTIEYTDGESYPCVIYNESANTATYIYSDLRNGYISVTNGYAATKYSTTYETSLAQFIDPLLGGSPITHVWLPIFCKIAEGTPFYIGDDTSAKYVRSTTLAIGGA